MGNLGDFLKAQIEEEIRQKFFDAAEKENADQEPRSYLGASIIGHPCERRLYFSYTAGFQPVEGRVACIFEMGHIMEDMIVEKMNLAGYKLSGEQTRFEDFNGNFAGHCDSIASEIIQENDGSLHDAIVEIKSANDKKFKQMKMVGVCAVYPTYAGQVQVYMHYQKLKYAVFIVMNKNNCDLHTEIVEYNRDEALRLIAKAERIINATSEPPIPEGFNASCFDCTYCSYNNLCYGGGSDPF